MVYAMQCFECHVHSACGKQLWQVLRNYGISEEETR